MTNTLLRLPAVAFLIGSLGVLGAQSQCRLPVSAQSCSYSALNGSCTVNINRLHPISTPTIYARRGSVITVIVEHPSPFEQLYLDLKSATAQASPDQFANGFASLTGALSGFQITGAMQPPGPAPAPPPPQPEQEHAAQPQKSPLDTILDAQKDLKGAMDTALKNSLSPAREAVKLIHKVELPLPVEACQSDNPAVLLDWLDTTRWKAAVKSNLDMVVAYTDTTGFQNRLDDIKDKIREFGRTASDRDFALVNGNQKSLAGELDAVTQTNQKFQALLDASQRIPDSTSPSTFYIRDVQPHDKDIEIQAWSLDYVNQLGRVGKQVSGDKFVDDDSAALSGIADQDNKQSIATVNVQYQRDSRLEISTGLLVPATPYHSYTAVQAQGASSPTIQENDTYTLVPAAFFNVLLGKELVAAKQRVAWLASGAVGYTPATSSVALAPGLCFSWRSIVVGAHADIGRDVKLAGNWTVGESLGSVSAPETTNVWDVKPAFSLSVRIPLGGGSH
jgi:hypothetical protein